MITITRSRDFDFIFRRGRSVASPEMIIYYMRHAKTRGRVAFCVSKKLGCAVVRNRMRRRLREVYRLNCEKLDTRCDLILLARTATMKATFAMLEKRFLSLIAQAGLVVKSKLQASPANVQ